MSNDILSAAEIECLVKNYDRMEMTWVDDDTAFRCTVGDVCRSHEALRAENEKLTVDLRVKLRNSRHWIDEMQRSIDERCDEADRDYPDPENINNRAAAFSNLVLRCEEILAEMRADSPPFGVRASDVYQTDDGLRKERDDWRQRVSDYRRALQREHVRAVRIEGILRQILDLPARRIVGKTGTVRDWLPTTMREEACTVCLGKGVDAALPDDPCSETEKKP